MPVQPALPVADRFGEVLRSAKIRLEGARDFLAEAQRRLGLIVANGEETRDRCESLRLQVAAHIATQTAQLAASAALKARP